MSRKNRTPEENARRAKIRELLQEANISSMADMQCFPQCIDKLVGGRIVLSLVIHPPVKHGTQNGLQAFADLRQRVFDAGRHLRVGFACQKPVYLHVPQVGRQHLLGNAGQGFLKLSKALGAGKQIAQNEHLRSLFSN